MEIYKDLNNKATKEFETLLNTQLSKTKKLEEGKIYDAKVIKIGSKFLTLSIEGLKQDPVLDLSEIKSLGLDDKVKEGSIIPVLLEKIEDRFLNCVVSATKASKLRGWNKIVELYNKKEPLIGAIKQKIKGGYIVSHIESGMLCFLPGSQLDVRPLKDAQVANLMNVEQKFAILKCDLARGNVAVSRREILESGKQESRAKILSKYPVGTIIKGCVAKSISKFGVFFDVAGEIDVLVHQSELSHAHVNDPAELVSIGDTMDLMVISQDMTKGQLGMSLRKMMPDPYEKVSNLELNKPLPFKIMKIKEYGFFAEAVGIPGLVSLCHQSEVSHTQKNPNLNKLFKVGQTVMCSIFEVSKEKRRILISYKMCIKNPYDMLPEVGSVASGVISNTNEYACFITLDGLDIQTFCHCNDISFFGKPEENLKKMKKGDKVKVKILSIDKNQQKVRTGIRQANEEDPFEFFKKRNLGVKSIVTVKVIKSDNKFLYVKIIGCEGLEFSIKKQKISLDPESQRPQRFTGNEEIDCAIEELNFETRKCQLSIKLLEEIQKAEALEKYGEKGLLSGKNLPFSLLDKKLEKNKKK